MTEKGGEGILEAALVLIRDTLGHVCDNFELCTHVACRDSYSAWQVASRALQEYRIDLSDRPIG